MSHILNLVEHLLADGRRFQQLGRRHDAVRVLERLSCFELMDEVRNEVHGSLGSLCLKDERFEEARTHLRKASPVEAETQRLLARSYECDEEANLEEALDHYRKALRIKPDQPECLAAFGELAVSLGQVEEGLAALRRAVELVPDEAKILGQLLEALASIGQVDEARVLLRAARFQHPRHLGFRKLWSDFEFRILHDRQEAEAAWSVDTSDERDLLPFVAAASAEVETKTIRVDGPHAPTGPIGPRPRLKLVRPTRGTRASG